jgi:hypothetical protein
MASERDGKRRRVGTVWTVTSRRQAEEKASWEQENPPDLGESQPIIGDQHQAGPRDRGVERIGREVQMLGHQRPAY